MEPVLYAEVDLVCAIVMLFILPGYRGRRVGNMVVDERLFDELVIANLLVLLFDAGTWVLDGMVFPGARPLSYFVNAVYYAMNGVVCWQWLRYTDYKLYQDQLRLKQRQFIYALPMAVNTVFSVLSPFTHLLFSLDAQNHYARGPWQFITVGMSLLYLGYSILLTVHYIYRNPHGQDQVIYRHLILFPVLMMAAAVVQIAFFGLSIIWATTSMVFLSIYFHVQSRYIYCDSLTGLYNRRQFEEYMRMKIKAYRGKRCLFLLMLDLNDFKGINDRFGHAVGDQALVETAALLRRCCGAKKDFLSRIGGDEFVIIGERQSEEEVAAFGQWVEEQARARTDGPYRLSLSHGYSLYRGGESSDEWFFRADEAMYAMKKTYQELNDQ